MSVIWGSECEERRRIEGASDLTARYQVVSVSFLRANGEREGFA